jgi:hypothetical protein
MARAQSSVQKEAFLAGLHHTGGLGFGEPATYRIVVQGRLERRHTAIHLIDAHSEQLNTATTTLIVQVMDQAGLSGKLDTLYGLHLPILSVELVSDKELADSQIGDQADNPRDAL